MSDANARAYNEKMGVVNAWLEFNDLPRDLRRKVRAYFKTFLAEKSALDEQAILNDLDPGLRAELGQHLIPDALGLLQVFSGLPPTVPSQIIVVTETGPGGGGRCSASTRHARRHDACCGGRCRRTFIR